MVKRFNLTYLDNKILLAQIKLIKDLKIILIEIFKKIKTVS